MTTQSDVLLYGAIYVAVSLIMGTATLFVFFKAFHLLTRNIDDIQEIKKNNISVAMINSAMVFSVALFVAEAADAAMEAFKNTIFNYAAVISLKGKLLIFGIMLSHFVLAALIAFAVLWLSIALFIRLTRTIDEFAEIRRDNRAVGIYLSVFIISIALILKPGVGRLLKGLIPFPDATSSPKISLADSRSFDAARHPDDGRDGCR